MAEAFLIITPNAEALEVLKGLLDVPDEEGAEPVWRTDIPLEITRADLMRYMYGNGDMTRIAFWITKDGVDGVAAPDPEMPTSAFEG
jgi:hypothetical protein